MFEAAEMSEVITRGDGQLALRQAGPQTKVFEQVAKTAKGLRRDTGSRHWRTVFILPPARNDNKWQPLVAKSCYIIAQEERLGLSHIALVQQSLIDVLPKSDTMARAFYRRLFELDPSLRSLFRHDPAEQRRKFTDMLVTLIQGLDRLNTVLPEIQQLGLRHAQYGVKPEHYALAGVALLWAMEHTLGHPLSQETRSAWIEAYELLTTAMQSVTAPQGVSPISHD
jgi:nitric oxide dioxygenase